MGSVVVEDEEVDEMGSVVDDAKEYLLKYFIVFDNGIFLDKTDLD